MKKTAVVLLVCLMCSSAFSFNLGADFGFFNGNKTAVAARMGITEKIEIKPQLGFNFTDGNSLFILGVAGNFYLPNIGDLQNYLGAGLLFSVTSYETPAILLTESEKETNTSFGLDFHYGLRYDFNDVVGVFGEVGLDMPISPDFQFGTFSSGVGLSFNILK